MEEQKQGQEQKAAPKQRQKQLVVSVMSEPVGQPVELGEHLRGHRVRSVLSQALGPEKMSFMPSSQRFVAQDSSTFSADLDLDSLIDPLLDNVSDDETVLLRPRTRARGGAALPGSAADSSTDDQPDTALLLTAAASHKVAAYSEEVSRALGNVECAFLMYGRRDEPTVISDVILLKKQRVAPHQFYVGDEGVTRTVEQAAEQLQGLVLKGVMHRHPGSGSGAVFHSRTDEHFIEGELMPLMAQLLFRATHWSRPLEVEANGRQGLRIALDEHSRRAVELSLPPRWRQDDEAPDSAPDAGADDQLAAVLLGQDMEATVYSVVFAADGSTFCRSVRYRTQCATTSSVSPLFVKENLVADVEVREVPTHTTSAPVARIPAQDLLRQEVRDNLTRSYTFPPMGEQRRRRSGSVTPIDIGQGSADLGLDGLGAVSALGQGAATHSVQAALQALITAGAALITAGQSLSSLLSDQRVGPGRH